MKSSVPRQLPLPTAPRLQPPRLPLPLARHTTHLRLQPLPLNRARLLALLAVAVAPLLALSKTPLPSRQMRRTTMPLPPPLPPVAAAHTVASR
jgi:hypothetical protein